jgi:hypothetical protein
MQSPGNTAYPFDQANTEQDYPAARMNTNSQQGSRQGDRNVNMSQDRPINSRFKGVDDFSKQEEEVQRSIKKFPEQEDLGQRSQYGGGGFAKVSETKQKAVQEGFVDHDDMVIPTSKRSSLRYLNHTIR